MLAVIVRMTPGPQAAEPHPSAALVEDLIWAVGEPQDCLEHLAVYDCGDLRAVVFVRAADADQAEFQAYRLCLRALARTSPLRGWSITGVSVPVDQSLAVDDPHRIPDSW